MCSPKKDFFATNFGAAGPNELSYFGVSRSDCARAQMLSRSGNVWKFNLKKLVVFTNLIDVFGNVRRNKTCKQLKVLYTLVRAAALEQTRCVGQQRCLHCSWWWWICRVTHGSWSGTKLKQQPLVAWNRSHSVHIHVWCLCIVWSQASLTAGTRNVRQL